ncbi:hypothetical protein H6G00_01280 [Leptolyngbya sp. FACHB-541]|uniref:hypothetical protein n=1 Tax=Leptolyngbya sp. FACHB-541 TaxID=2692810 RepID=UPI0016838553|nr:hypothetical protein [Leptolyngbya sp. FACHB-541]MBD1995262.1 hypothetical protein [Leptolyngbya sp. FACHB-541]
MLQTVEKVEIAVRSLRSPEGWKRFEQLQAIINETIERIDRKMNYLMQRLDERGDRGVACYCQDYRDQVRELESLGVAFASMAIMS